MVEEKVSLMSELYQNSIKNIKEGEITKGRIVSLGPKEVLIDIGYKSEGTIPTAQFSRDELKTGTEVDVYIESIENDAGMSCPEKRPTSSRAGIR